MRLHESLRTGGILAVCGAAVFALTSLPPLALRAGADLDLASADVAAIARTAAKLTQTLDDQRRLLNVETARRAALTQEVRAELSCPYPGATLGAGRDAVRCLDVGLLPAFRAAIAHTDENLNGGSGVLPLLAADLRELRTHQDEVLRSAKAALDKLGASEEELTRAIAALTALETDPTGLPKFLRELGLSAEEFHGILTDLRHPEKPGKFLRAVGIVLGLGRVAGPFVPLLR